MLIVVRHAPAAPGAPDAERPLTKEGRAVAQALGVDLVRLTPTHLVSSPARRCRETIEPVATALGRDVIIDEGLAATAKPAHVSLARAFLAGLDGVVLAVSHAPQIEELVGELLAEQGIALDATALHLPTGGYLVIDRDQSVKPARITAVRRYVGPGTEPLVLLG
jgi:phosphohistidine phosphatase SixA